jgi:plastocyanin
MHHRTRLASVSAVALALFVTACGGDPKGPPPPPPSGLSASQAAPSGDGQIGLVRTALASPLRIVVLDDGNPEAGVSVNWSGFGTMATFNPPSGTTDANGIASSTWTLPQEAGTATAQADVAGVSTPVIFTATGRPGAPVSLVLISGDGQAGGLGDLADDPLRVEVRDQYGNGVSGVTVDWAVNSDAMITPTVSQSGTNGQAEAIIRYGSTSIIPITATATVSGVGSVSFNLIAGHLVSVENSGGGPGGTQPQFFPSQHSINRGAYVVWKWADDAMNHNVVPDLLQPQTSGNPTDGPHTYVYQFTTAGNFAFYCINHGGPGGQNMSGLVSVN